MASPFQYPEIAQTIIKYWKCEPVRLDEFGITACYNRVTHFRGNFTVANLSTLYDSSFACQLSPSELNLLAQKLEALWQSLKLNSMAIRVGTMDPRALKPPSGYRWEKSDEIGIADLSEGFDRYLSTRRSGYIEYYKRGANRGLYETTIHTGNVDRSVFDSFNERFKETYLRRGYSYKSDDGLKDGLFSELQNKRALIYSVRARENPSLYADIFVLHDNRDAYYYLGTRNSERKGPLAGIAHFAQISLIRELAERGFSSYTLGFIGKIPGLPQSEIGVREFKLALSNRQEPLVKLRRDSIPVQAFHTYSLARNRFKALLSKDNT